MARKPTPPVITEVAGLRQRRRKDGSWRVWWEPNRIQRAAGFTAVDLDAERPGFAIRQAAELNAEAEAKISGKPRTTGTSERTISALIADYKASRFYIEKSYETQRTYRIDLNAIDRKWGPHGVVAFDTPTCNTWYEALLASKGVFRALAILRMFSILMKHAEVRGWRAAQSNPVKAISMKAPPGRDRICTWDEFDALMDAADTLGRPMDGLIVAMGIYTGQRVTDIINARPGDFLVTQIGRRKSAREGLVWILQQNKTGKAVQVPIHADLEGQLRSQIALAAAMGQPTLVWDEAKGKRFTLASMNKAWTRLRDEAAKAQPSITTLTQRDLRRTFSNNARAAGVSRDDLVDVMGNTLNVSAALAQVYTAPQLATALRAVDAVQKPKKERKQG